MTGRPAAELRAATTLRVAAAASAIGVEVGDLGGDLEALVAAAADPMRTDVLWLTATALLGRYPLPRELRAGRALLDLASPAEVAAALLAQALTAADPTFLRRGLLVLPGAVVVHAPTGATAPPGDGDLARLMEVAGPRWSQEHGAVLADAGADGTLLVPTRGEQLVAPWHGAVLVIGDATSATCSALTALAQHSGSTVAALPPTLLPVVSGGAVDDDRSDALAHLLGLLKHSHRIVALGDAAAQGYRGFAHAVAAQGLPAPQVRAVAPGAWQPSAPAARRAPTGDAPTVLALGDDASTEATVLEAATVLAERGHRFTLAFSGPPRSPAQRARLVSARESGLVLAEGAADRAGHADLVVCLTAGHHGIRLGEHLGAGTPAVVAASWAAEASLGLAQDGGCLVVDPLDDESVTTALERLLLDGASRDRLGTAASAVLVDLPGVLWRALTDEPWSA